MTHRLLAVLLGLTLLVAAGCSGDSNDDESSSSSSPSTESTSPSTSASASSLACDSLHSLEDDVSSMKNAKSVDEFQSGYNAAKQDYADLKPAASAAYGDDVDAIDQAMSDFGDALKSFGDQGALKGLQNLGKAAGNLDDSVSQLSTDLPCPTNS